MNAEFIARNLQKPSGSGTRWTACCPAHDDKNPSLSLRDEGDRVLWKCHTGCTQDAVRQALKSLGLLEQPNYTWSPPANRQQQQTLQDASKAELVRKLLAACEPAANSIVEKYLNSRGINVVPKQLLSHSNLWHSPGVSYPAMVARVLNPMTRQDTGGIHRTWLARDGQGKAPVDPDKKMLGSCKGGVVLLGEHIKGQPVLLGEGIETVLAGVQAKGLFGMAALSAGNLERLELPIELGDVIILADNDTNGVGQNAAHTLANRLDTNGRRVRIAIPPTNGDVNDILNWGAGE